jgi:CheY-like chemotaxis protein
MDPSQIDQILANLCVNARDAIRGTGRIVIETQAAFFDESYCSQHPGFLPGRYVLLAVRDDGCGMDPETRAHLFEPFFTTKGVGQGTGLGLATVYGIVSQNEGFIDVESKAGEGAAFRIYLPCHAAEGGEAASGDAAEPAARGNETILLVEDESMVLNMTKAMLERHGYTVITAETPGEAIRLAQGQAGDIHLLMTDVIMPEMNGRDLARELQALNPDLKCLFMSGYTADVIAHHGVLEPGVHFLQKPFSMSALTAKVRDALDQSQPATEA